MDNPEGEVESIYALRFRQINAAISGLHDTALEALAPGTSEARKELLGATAVAHMINVVGFGLMALTEIAQAQNIIASIVGLDYENNHPPEPINPNSKIERNPIGKKRSPLTPPE